VDLHWWSVEVRDGSFSGAVWRDAHGDALIEAAVAHGAREWGWVKQPWGIVFEIAFAEPEDWARFRGLPAVTAALDAVPDRIHGLYIYPGRGGGAGAGKRRWPRLPRGAGAAPIPEEPRPVLVAGRPEAELQPPTISVA
jgi:hypothetical protein